MTTTGRPVRRWVSTSSSSSPRGSTSHPMSVRGSRTTKVDGRRHRGRRLPRGAARPRRGGLRAERRVVVDPEPVGRALDRVEVTVPDQLGVGQHGGHREQALVVAPVDQGAEPDPVAEASTPSVAATSAASSGSLGPDRREVEHDADVGDAGLVRRAAASPWPGAGGARPGGRRRPRAGPARARRRRSRGRPRTTARCGWPTTSPGRPAGGGRPRRTRRTPRRCRAPASRPRPRAAAAGPSGRASRRARCRAPAARRPGGRSSRARGPPPGRCPRA